MAALGLTAAAGAGEGEARVSLDVKDAPVVEIVHALAQAGGFQVAFDPGITCQLTMKLNAARWRSILDSALSSSGLSLPSVE